MTQHMNIVSFQASVSNNNKEYYLDHHHAEYQNQILMDDPIAFKASTNPDVMYFHKAMRAPDQEQFKQAIVDKVNAHIEGKHWEMVPIS